MEYYNWWCNLGSVLEAFLIFLCFQDIGHAILEAYSRILASLAFRILSRIREILQEDALSNASSTATPSCFSGSNDMFRTPERLLVSSRLRHSLIHDINKADDGTRNSLE